MRGMDDDDDDYDASWSSPTTGSISNGFKVEASETLNQTGWHLNGFLFLLSGKRRELTKFILYEIIWHTEERNAGSKERRQVHRLKISGN